MCYTFYIEHMPKTFIKEVFLLPKFDGTGPNGSGKLTGRGLGSCSSDASTQVQNNNLGRNLGRGCKRISRPNGLGRCIRKNNQGNF